MDIPADSGSRRYDWRRYDSPSDGIIAAVADSTGKPPGALPPIPEAVDDEAMRRLIADSSDTSNGQLRITFEYAGVEVTVERDGAIEVDAGPESPGDSPPDPRTAEELSATLKRLFGAAAENDIGVEGGWSVRNGPELPDWDIHVTQLEKPDQRD